MKRVIVASLLISTFTGFSAFGQGYVNFSTFKSVIYDTFTTPGVGVLNSTVNVALMWGSQSATPLVDALGASTPTSGFPNIAPAWRDLMTDPRFQFAQDGGVAGNPITVGRSNTRGAITYGNFAVVGTTAGTIYSFFMVSWNALYANPAAAAAANSAVGWSVVYDYTTTVATAPSGSVELSHSQAFGTCWPIPEPVTLTLAGLGGLSLLLFRRRK